MAGVSAATISRIERGHLDELSLRTVRAVAKQLEIRVELLARWRAGELDRLVNARHSAMHETLACVFDDQPDWVAAPEVSFAIYGERGVVDVQDLVGSVDRKRRLAAVVARERGWVADTVSVWVVVEEGRANRRRVEAHRSMLRHAFAADGRAIRTWLRRPTGAIAALSFLSIYRPWERYADDAGASASPPTPRERVPGRLNRRTLAERSLIRSAARAVA